MHLDVFRGLAALLMVLNHAGYAWLAAQHSGAGLTGLVVFAGGFAPVLFYFATGLGMGWSGQRRAMDNATWAKAGLLVLADALLNWSQGGWWGVNFFGFTALSMVVVGLVRASARPVRVASLVLAMVLLARYGLVPWLREASEANAWVGFLTGIQGRPAISYPAGPWLAYPLLGFILAYLAAGVRVPAWLSTSGLGAAALASALLAGGLVLHRGAVLHRWSSMSAAYFLLSLGVLALAWWAAGWLARQERASAALALRGPASLLVVPLHYAAIGALAGVLPLPLLPAVWWAAAVALCVAVMWACRRMNRAFTGPLPGGWPLLIMLAVLTVGCLAWRGVGLATLLLACAGQTAVAWHLAAGTSQARKPAM